MRNITVSVPDEVYLRARVRAAEQDRSVSGLVREFLQSLWDDKIPNEFKSLEQQQEAIFGSITDFKGGHRLNRDEVHDRNALR